VKPTQRNAGIGQFIWSAAGFTGQLRGLHGGSAFVVGISAPGKARPCGGSFRRQVNRQLQQGRRSGVLVVGQPVGDVQ